MKCAVEVVIRLANESSSTQAALLADGGVCAMIDSILGQKLHVASVCGLCLEAILAVISPDMDGVTPSSSADSSSAQRKRLTGSATIFRLIKACHTHSADSAILLTGLRIVLIVIEECGEASKLVSCGICDLLAMAVRQHSPVDAVVVMACRCTNALILFDLEENGGALGTQDKLADTFLCELLVGKVLQSKLVPTLSSASWALKVVGSLARRSSSNKERLAACGACEAVPQLCSEAFLCSSDFAESVCWCFANLSFPDDVNQGRLGASGACGIVVSILKQHANNVMLIQEGARALHQLGELHDSNLQLLNELDAPAFCMELIRKYDSRHDVLQWVMYALATLAESSTALARLHEDGLCAEVVALTNRYVANEDLVQWASMTIANISAEPALAEQLHQHLCCQVLIQALVRHMSNEDVCEEVLHAMGALAVALLDSRQTFVENSIADFVMKTLEQHVSCETVCEQGIFALCKVMQVSGDAVVDAGSTEIRRAVFTKLDHIQRHLLKSMSSALHNNGGFRLLPKMVSKFAGENAALAAHAVQLLCSVSLGCVLLDERMQADESKGSNSIAMKVDSSADSCLAKLGAGGAAALFCSVLAQYMHDANVTFWCLLGMAQLSTVLHNISILRTGDVCNIIKGVLETYGSSNVDVTTLAFELIAHLSIDTSCRMLLGNVLFRGKDSRHLVLKSMGPHMSSARAVAAGCKAISSLCFSPTDDALSSLFETKEPNKYASIKLIAAPEAASEPARRPSNADWTTFGDNTDHLNAVIPENELRTEVVLSDTTGQVDQPSLHGTFMRGLSMMMGKRADSEASALLVSKPAIPISANHELSQQAAQVSGNLIMDAATSLISTGLSDQEEKVIKALRQRANQQKSNSECLVEGGCLQLLLKVLKSNSMNYNVLVQVVNALNSLALHTSNRFKIRELGLLEALATVHSRAVQDYNGQAVRDLAQLDVNELQDADWIRVLAILITITLGTCCLSDSMDTANTKHAVHNAAVLANQEQLGGLSVLEALATCLTKSVWDVTLCEVILRAFYLLVINNESNQFRIGQIMVEGGHSAAYHVVQVLREKLDIPRISYYSCVALAAIAMDNERNSFILDDCGVCAVVMRVLLKYMDHEEVVEACCQAIHGLKCLNDKLGKGGACEYIVQALTTHASSTVVAEWVCRAIGSLAESKYNKIEFEKHHITKIVTSTLLKHVSNESYLNAFSKDTSGAGVAQWGCTAIYYLAQGYDAEGFQQRLVAAGACDAVAKALMKYAEVEAVAYSCCRALVVLVDNNETLKSKPLLSGVCQYIVESLHLFPSSVLVAKWGCRAAAVLAESHEANIAKLGAAGACESIPLIIQSHPNSEQVAVAGCKVIAFMSEQTVNGFAVRFGHAGACEAVVGALKKHIQSPLAVTRASIAINTLAMVPGNARWFGPAGAGDVLHAALLLHIQDASVAKFVIAAIGQLCIIDHNKERLGLLGVCEAVVQAAEIHVSDLDSAQSCADTIGKLCEFIGKAQQVKVSDTELPSAWRDAVQANAHYQAGRRNRAVLYECGACKVLVKALDNHLADESAAQCVCRAIAIIAQGDSCALERNQMGGLGVCGAVTKALTFHEGVEETAMCACSAVQALALNLDINKAAFHRAGACQLVVQVLRAYRHSANTSATEAAARAINNLSVDCADNKLALGAASACEGLLEVTELYIRQIDLTFVFIKALFHVCDGSSINRTKISFSGAADILHAVLVRYMDEEKVVDFVLSIMIGMCMDKVGQSKLGAVGLPRTLMTVMNRYEKASEHISALVLVLVGALSRGSRPNQDKLDQCNACKMLATVLSKCGSSNTGKAEVSRLRAASSVAFRSLSPLVPSSSSASRLFAFSTPSDHDESTSSSTASSANVSALLVSAQDADVSLVEYIGGEVNVLKEACRAVCLLCAEHEPSKQKMLALGALDTLTALVSSALPGDGAQEGLGQARIWARNAMELLMSAASSSSRP